MLLQFLVHRPECPGAVIAEDIVTIGLREGEDPQVENEDGIQTHPTK
jgi:hypothetical protein